MSTAPDPSTPVDCTPEAGPSPARSKFPLWARVLVGVMLGALVGYWFEREPIVAGFGCQELERLGNLVIMLLKALATPLVFFAIVDAFISTEITGRQGLKLVVICAINIVVAFAIGLALLNTLQPGSNWRGRMESVAPQTDAAAPAKTLPLVDYLVATVPDSVARPFLENNVLPVVILGVLVGAALRSLRRQQSEAGHSALTTLEHFFSAGFQVLARILAWIIQLIPWAVFAIVAGVVSKIGMEAYAELVPVFLGTVLLGLTIHALVYYPLSAWLAGGKSPRAYLAGVSDPVGTGFSINSSLATVPVTLRALDQLGVSPASARLSACVGTNFNNDGITLYEAMTALFVAQAAGMNLNLTQQVGVLAAALLACLGVAGIPNSGLIILPLVLKAANLPDEVVAMAYPIILSVDFFVARCRSAVNVMGDMQVAILLDGRRPVAEPSDPQTGSV